MPKYALKTAKSAIEEINTYRTTYGNYPDSFKINRKPGLVGTSEFIYRKHDTAYTLEFWIPVTFINSYVFIYDPHKVFDRKKGVRDWSYVYVSEEMDNGWLKAWTD